MLKHEDNPDIHLTSAAQVRVTPEELAKAITCLEARKASDQRQADGTIPIGEAVQQLGLEATSEEVLAEVETERARLSEAKKQRLSRRQRWGLAVAAGTLALSLTGWWEAGRQPSDMKASGTSVTSAAPTVVTKNVILDRSPRELLIDPDHLQVGTASGKLALISEVGDNQIFHTRLYGKRDWGDYFPSDAVTTWTLIKHGGKVYLRGWVQRVSEKLIQTDGVDLANRRDGQHVIPISLSLEGFKAAPDGSSGETAEYNAEDIHLDKHAWEKWQP